MKRNPRFPGISLAHIIVAALLLWGITASAPTAHAQILESRPVINTEPYLELSVDPPLALPGTLVTLTIVYHNLGLPHTMINFNPDGLVAFDPPLLEQCEYGCGEYTLRALQSGVVEIHAGATGEIYDESCGCWRWSGATDNGPARLVITETLWQLYLPYIPENP
jgi:hypothetical protein